MHHYAKFRQNLSIRCGVIAIFQFFKMTEMLNDVGCLDQRSVRVGSVQYIAATSATVGGKCSQQCT